MFEQAQANTSIGTAYIYDEDGSLLGEYDNGSAKAAGRTEYIWLPVENGQPIPVGILRNGNFFAIHSDHLGTPRLMTNEDNKPVWQWPYSAFGANKPTGILQATPNPRVAITNQPVLLKATAATELNLRFPGQYFDSETNLHYNYFRSYQPNQGRYTQADPIGLEGGLNRFGYVGGNTLGYTDPLGLQIVIPGPGGVPIPVILPAGGRNTPPALGWDAADGPVASSGNGSIIWPPGFSPKPEPTTCNIEVPSRPPQLPPKNDCESQLKVCTDIARSYPVITKMAMMGACFVQYAICKKVFKDN